MNIEFNNYISELIEYSKGKQDGEKEIVSYDQALRACYYIFHIVPRKIGDLLLYCSSLSLMNSYVKQQDGAFYRKYSFKNNGLNRLMELLKKLSFIDGFKMMFEVDKEKNNSTLLYTSIYGMHFCFHGIDNKFKDMIPEKYLGDFEWDGIKKQMCASTLFDMIEKSDLLVSESGRKTLNLKESARIESQKVLTGKISKRTFTNECGFYNPNLKE